MERRSFLQLVAAAFVAPFAKFVSPAKRLAAMAPVEPITVAVRSSGIIQIVAGQVIQSGHAVFVGPDGNISQASSPDSAFLGFAVEPRRDDGTVLVNIGEPLTTAPAPD